MYTCQIYVSNTMLVTEIKRLYIFTRKQYISKRLFLCQLILLDLLSNQFNYLYSIIYVELNMHEYLM